ncbi:MAG: hypothetical protein WC915_06510 [archaeon]
MSIFLVVLLSVSVLAVEPFGSSVTQLSSTRAPEDIATSDNAIAGNITELGVSGFSVTQSWQGYFGNVTGTIQLADNGDNVMYNWSLASPEGEIYASRLSTINWYNIQCLGDELGVNFTTLETDYGIANDDVDGVNETFTWTGSHENGENLSHDLFYTNNIEFLAGECASTHLFADSNSSEDSTFQEVLLLDNSSISSTNVVFASILDEENPLGFDGRAHDFEMLVLENGHSTDTATTTYYFWVELE